MKRRNFLRSSLGAGLAAGAFMSFGRYEKAFAGKPLPPATNYDLIAVMGGEPAAMFDMGIQSLGGMGTFVRKGQ
ncbi:MAG: tat (twin-arginine translocation) pathway signal sequence, partial [Actinomycetota bacterium]